MKAFQKGMREGKKMKEKGRKRGKKERSKKRTENRGMVGKKGGIESKICRCSFGRLLHIGHGKTFTIDRTIYTPRERSVSFLCILSYIIY